MGVGSSLGCGGLQKYLELCCADLQCSVLVVNKYVLFFFVCDLSLCLLICFYKVDVQIRSIF